MATLFRECSAASAISVEPGNTTDNTTIAGTCPPCASDGLSSDAPSSADEGSGGGSSSSTLSHRHTRRRKTLARNVAAPAEGRKGSKGCPTRPRRSSSNSRSSNHPGPSGDADSNCLKGLKGLPQPEVMLSRRTIRATSVHLSESELSHLNGSLPGGSSHVAAGAAEPRPSAATTAQPEESCAEVGAEAPSFLPPQPAPKPMGRKVKTVIDPAMVVQMAMEGLVKLPHAEPRVIRNLSSSAQSADRALNPA